MSIGQVIGISAFTIGVLIGLWLFRDVIRSWWNERKR
jgi:hypothetical protein